MKILINTISTKKRAGGVFQISLNFLLKSLEHTDVEWYYIASQDVDDAIGERFESLRGTRYFVFPTQPDFMGTYWNVKKELAKLEDLIKPDLIYSIAAPSYFSFKTKEVMRCTNPWVSHPNKYSWSVLPLKSKIAYYLKGLNTKIDMRKAEYFVTQTETCAKGIIRVTGVPGNHVKVVNNVLPSVFLSIDRTPIPDSEWINIACVGNDTPHKNFDILPDVIVELGKLGLTNVRFLTTLNKNGQLANRIDTNLKTKGLSEHLVNYGRVSQQQLGEMYRRCQFAFLPTLLEVFSASTVEAMYFGLPVVATDFSFNTEVFDDACLYYEPKNAIDAASKIAQLISDSNLQESLRERMLRRLEKYGDYDNHFNAIKDFLIKVGGGYNWIILYKSKPYNVQGHRNLFADRRVAA